MTGKNPSSFVFKRRVAHAVAALLFFIVPFINVNGKPLLRFDVYELSIYIFGHSISADNIFTILLILFACLFLFLYFTQVFGRIWCGWMCPQTIWLEPLRLIKFKKKAVNTASRAAVSLVAAILGTAGLAMYFMKPHKFFEQLIHGDIFFLWYIIAAILFLNIFLIGRKFCKTVCPYSMFQSIMFDADTLRVALKPELAEECINCGACVRICPTALDIRQGLSNKCVLCASCVDACGKIMARLGKTSLVGYVFGRGKFHPFSVAKAIMLGLAILFFIMAILYTPQDTGSWR